MRSVAAEPFPDLVNRDFRADGPDRLWVADITQLPTRSGSCYLASIVDAFSRRVVGALPLSPFLHPNGLDATC